MRHKRPKTQYACGQRRSRNSKQLCIDPFHMPSAQRPSTVGSSYRSLESKDDVVTFNKNRFFLGELPTTPMQIYTRLLMVSGLRAQVFARDSRGHKVNRSTLGGRSLAIITQTETSEFLQIYLYPEGQTIEAILIDSEAEYLRESKKQKSKEKEMAHNETRLYFTLLQTMKKVRTISQRDILDMDIRKSVLSRTRTANCSKNQILSRIRSCGLSNRRRVKYLRIHKN